MFLKKCDMSSLNLNVLGTYSLTGIKHTTTGITYLVKTTFKGTFTLMVTSTATYIFLINFLVLYTWRVVTEAKELLPLLPLKPRCASVEKVLKDQSVGGHDTGCGGWQRKEQLWPQGEIAPTHFSQQFPQKWD